eukprot:gene13977-32317_t
MYTTNPAYRALGDPEEDPFSFFCDGDLTRQSCVGGWVR